MKRGKKKEENIPLRVGMLFSGIDAFEQVLLQLGISHHIVFACDNGERYIKGKNGKVLEK